VDGDVQSCGFSRSVLTVREEASCTFAVLDVGASRPFEQPKAREHGGQSSNAFRASPQATIDKNPIPVRITGAFAVHPTDASLRSDLTLLPVHLSLMATRRKTEQRDRAGSIKGQLGRIESVSYFSIYRADY